MRFARTARLAVATAAAALLLSGCELQLEIDFTIRNDAYLKTDAYGGPVVELSGVLACSKGSPSAATSEHLDLFVDLTQGTEEVGAELYDVCSPPKVWKQSLPVTPAITKGQAVVEITVCTNPGLPIDEDCTTDVETVTIR